MRHGVRADDGKSGREDLIGGGWYIRPASNTLTRLPPTEMMARMESEWDDDAEKQESEKSDASAARFGLRCYSGLRMYAAYSMCAYMYSMLMSIYGHEPRCPAAKL